MTYYRLNCEICDYNLVTNGFDIKLTEYKRSNIQSDIPKYDAEAKKTIYKDFIKMPKKYKCPQCGRLISARPLKENKPEDKTKNFYEPNFDAGSKGGFERL